MLARARADEEHPHGASLLGRFCASRDAARREIGEHSSRELRDGNRGVRQGRRPLQQRARAGAVRRGGRRGRRCRARRRLRAGCSRRGARTAPRRPSCRRGRPVGALRRHCPPPRPGSRHPRGRGRGAAVRRRELRPRALAARRQLHQRPAACTRRDASGRPANRRCMCLGLRRRDDDAAVLLGCGARARPERARRGSRDALLLTRGGRRALVGGVAPRRRDG